MPRLAGAPVTAHWGVKDPTAVVGTENTRRRAFLGNAAVALLANSVATGAGLYALIAASTDSDSFPGDSACSNPQKILP